MKSKAENYTNTIKVLVKGNVFDASDAASRHCVSVTWTKETTDRWGCESHGEVMPEYHDCVMQWFCEPGLAPFPPGTLLHYSLPKELR